MDEASASGSWTVECVHVHGGVSIVIPFGESMEMASTAVSRRDFLNGGRDVLGVPYAMQ